jgi:hypothetical protein
MRTSIGTAPHSPESNWILGPQRLKPKYLRSPQSARVELVPFPILTKKHCYNSVKRPLRQRGYVNSFEGRFYSGSKGLGGATRMKTSSHL